MRKEIYRMADEQAVALLARARTVHLAATDGEGAPILRALHAVVVDGALAFHGAPAGEKVEAIGRPAVVGAEEIVADVPSWFIDPERACPATTYYRSAQAHGPLERVDDPQEKGRVLQALMEKYQPEGGHVPVDASHPLYRKAVAGVLILRVRLDAVDGKSKLGQNRTPDELAHILGALWRRGKPDDPRAIEVLRDAHPSLPTPEFLRAPAGVRLVCAMDEERDLPSVVDLLADEYWNRGVARSTIVRAHPSATAWVGARDASGRAVASARAMSDGKRAWIYDVVVDAAWRGRGVGQAVVRLLLDHPALREVGEIRLGTRDAQALYRRFGFIDLREAPPRPFVATEMVRLRGTMAGCTSPPAASSRSSPA